MMQDTQKMIADFIEQIECSICDPEYETQTVLYKSQIQLSRDFISAVGCTPNEYLRRRRLSVALSMLKATDKRIADIAHECGYSSQQAFSREIKSMLYMTAKEYRFCECLYYYPPYRGEVLFSVTVTTLTIPQTRELVFTSDRAIGIEQAAVELFFRQNMNYSGVLFGRNGVQNGTKFTYSLFVNNECQTNGFICNGIHPSYSALFAVTSCPNIDKDIGRAWDYHYNTWLQGSIYEHTDDGTFNNGYFEEYLVRKGRPYRLRLCVPIKKKLPVMNIRLIEGYTAEYLICETVGNHAEEKASLDFSRSEQKYCRH